MRVIMAIYFFSSTSEFQKSFFIKSALLQGFGQTLSLLTFSKVQFIQLCDQYENRFRDKVSCFLFVLL